MSAWHCQCHSDTVDLMMSESRQVKSSASWPNAGLPSTSHVFFATCRQRGTLRPK